MAAPVDYRVVEHYRLSELVDIVKHYIRSGWVPQGGVAVAANDGGSIHGYTQAMVKYAETK